MNISENWFYALKKEGVEITQIPCCAIPFQLESDGVIDLDTLNPEEHPEFEESFVYNSFELDSDEELSLSGSADWYWEVYLNGEKIFSVMETGNKTCFFQPGYHFFTGLGRKGKNLLTVHIRRGANSGSFGFAEMRPLPPPKELTVTVDPDETLGKIKYMNAVNNGPCVARGDQTRGNLPLWKAAKIPYARNHDAAFWSGYGGEHSVDIHAIFPDFSKDPYDPASYDFTLTDRFHFQIMEGGTKVFFRLGSKIEHNPKKYGTKVPPDFKKWAVICEHIIRHCNEGWAEGHHMNIEYWEIWNEPDLSSGQEDKKTWQGTDEEFFELFRIAATHLKKCFPHLKIGGPALAGNQRWLKRFLAAMVTGERVPMDFFSWHIYCTEPAMISATAGMIRKMLDDHGYDKTESILNEWNYVRSWSAEFIYSIETIISIKGAVFTAAGMSSGQDAPVDMLMYYDARPCAFNGMFDFYTFRPLKGYYPFIAWSKLLELGTQIKVDNGGRNSIYATAAADGKGKIGMLLSNYVECDELPEAISLTVKVKGTDLTDVKLYIVDRERSFEETSFRKNSDGGISFEMEPNTFVYLEKI